MTNEHRATLDATILLRARVNAARPVPSLGDCILLNAALHVEGRTPHTRTAGEVLTRVRRPAEPQIVVDGIGESVLRFTPNGDAARDLLQELTQSDAWQWLGNSLCVDHRLAGGLIEHLAGSGLRVTVL